MPLGQPLATPESPLPRLQSGLVEETLRDPSLLQKSTRSLTRAGEELAAPLSPPMLRVVRRRCSPLPAGVGGEAFAESHSVKGRWTSPAPAEKKGATQPHTTGGGGTTHPGTRSLKRLCRPRDHPPRLHANGQGVSLAPLDQGYRHANCWLRARQLMQKPRAPQVLSIRGAGWGEEMK